MRHHYSNLRVSSILRSALGLMFVAAGLCSSVVQAQTSSSYAIDGHVLNSGGHPAGGIVSQSSSYRITLDAIGDAIAPKIQTSSAYSVQGGTGATHHPPGEVSGVAFNSKTAVGWVAHSTAGTYNVYRAAMPNFVSSGFGSCFAYAIESTTATDTDAVSTGAGFFYLITVANPLGQEGTKGYRTGGVERPNLAPCP